MNTYAHTICSIVKYSKENKKVFDETVDIVKVIIVIVFTVILN